MTARSEPKDNMVAMLTDSLRTALKAPGYDHDLEELVYMIPSVKNWKGHELNSVNKYVVSVADRLPRAVLRYLHVEMTEVFEKVKSIGQPVLNTRQKLAVEYYSLVAMGNTNLSDTHYRVYRIKTIIRVALIRVRREANGLMGKPE